MASSNPNRTVKTKTFALVHQENCTSLVQYTKVLLQIYLFDNFLKISPSPHSWLGVKLWLLSGFCQARDSEPHMLLKSAAPQPKSFTVQSASKSRQSWRQKTQRRAGSEGPRTPCSKTGRVSLKTPDFLFTEEAGTRRWWEQTVYCSKRVLGRGLVFVYRFPACSMMVQYTTCVLPHNRVCCDRKLIKDRAVRWCTVQVDGFPELFDLFLTPQQFVLTKEKQRTCFYLFIP